MTFLRGLNLACVAAGLMFSVGVDPSPDPAQPGGRSRASRRTVQRIPLRDSEFLHEGDHDLHSLWVSAQTSSLLASGGGQAFSSNADLVSLPSLPLPALAGKTIPQRHATWRSSVTWGAALGRAPPALLL